MLIQERDGSVNSAKAPTHMLSLVQCRKLMTSLGLKLTPAAFAVFVRLFSAEAGGDPDMVTFDLFVKKLGGETVGESHALGMPSDIAKGGRVFHASPWTPRPPPSPTPYGVMASDPVELVRYKLGQRGRKVRTHLLILLTLSLLTTPTTDSLTIAAT